MKIRTEEKENLQQMNQTEKMVDPRRLANQHKPRYNHYQDSPKNHLKNNQFCFRQSTWMLRKENTRLRLRLRHVQVGIKTKNRAAELT